MIFPTEQHLPNVRPADLRYYQARYFFEKFKESCGSPEKPSGSSFHWVTYSDAFLMALVSLQDFVGDKKRRTLLRGAYSTHLNVKTKGPKAKLPKDCEPNVFLVLKLMRNQTIHRYVFASPGQKSRVKPSVSRIINVSVGGDSPGSWVQPRIHAKVMRRVLKRVTTRFKNQKKFDPTSDVFETRLYLKRRKKEGSGRDSPPRHLQRGAEVRGEGVRLQA